MNWKTRIMGGAALAVVAASCGDSQAKYDAAVKEAALQKTEAEALQAKVDEANARADKLLSALGMAQTQTQAMTEAQKARLEEAKQTVAEAEAREKLQSDLIAKLQKTIDTGTLKIEVRRGLLVLALPSDVLFETGETKLKPDGKKAIDAVAAALRSLKGKRFQVAGHTDTAPIVSDKKKEFPTNWELSAARAIEVVKLLIASGVNPSVLSAAGYGPYDPVAPNATPDGQAKNRRIEVTLQPDIGPLVTGILPELKKPK